MTRATRKYIGRYLYDGQKNVEITVPLVSIDSDSRAVRESHKAGMTIYRLSGKWTGYSYEIVDRFIAADDAKKIRSLIKKIDKRNPPRPRRILTDGEKIAQWSRRLARLTGIDNSAATEIADEKIEFAEDNAQKIMDTALSAKFYNRGVDAYNRVIAHPSAALKYIQNADHAQAILAASYRHTHTDYEEKLAEGRELADRGDLERSEVRDYARQQKN